jgi:hypothetical protein
MAVWPDLPAGPNGGRTVRELLDYVVWVTEQVERTGAHGGLDLEPWRQRVHRAYLSLIDSMVPGHGDPLPPDVPPSVQPGQWPDIAAAEIPGMTVRHQLTVLRTVAGNARAERPHQPPADTERWAERIRATFDALDHGPTLPMPPEARTSPPAPPPSAPKRSGAKSKAKPAKRRDGAKVKPRGAKSKARGKARTKARR